MFQVLVGVFEETLFRGMLFRFLEEGFGSWMALTITALFFGLSHLNNPHATVWSAIAIALMVISRCRGTRATGAIKNQHRPKRVKM